jgi:transposase
MSRKKKKRSGSGQTVFIDIQRRSEKLADPDSYESRKRKNLEQKRKVKSVYQKEVEAAENGNSQEQRKTPLADKIRRLKKQQSEQSEQPEQPEKDSEA